MGLSIVIIAVVALVVVGVLIIQEIQWGNKWNS